MHIIFKHIIVFDVIRLNVMAISIVWTIYDDFNLFFQPDPRELAQQFEEFYEDIFEELSKHGELENLNVCENQADHMVSLAICLPY